MNACDLFEAYIGAACLSQGGDGEAYDALNLWLSAIF